MRFYRQKQQNASTLKKITGRRTLLVPCALSRIYADVAYRQPRQHSARDELRRRRLQLRQRWWLDGDPSKHDLRRQCHLDGYAPHVADQHSRRGDGSRRNVWHSIRGAW